MARESDVPAGATGPLGLPTCPDRSQTRLQVIQCHDQGWTEGSISCFLHVSRPTVDAWVRRFEAEQLAGPMGKKRGPKNPRKGIGRALSPECPFASSDAIPVRGDRQPSTVVIHALPGRNSRRQPLPGNHPGRVNDQPLARAVTLQFICVSPQPRRRGRLHGALERFVIPHCSAR